MKKQERDLFLTMLTIVAIKHPGYDVRSMSLKAYEFCNQLIQNCPWLVVTDTDTEKENVPKRKAA